MPASASAEGAGDCDVSRLLPQVTDEGLKVIASSATSGPWYWAVLG